MFLHENLSFSVKKKNKTASVLFFSCTLHPQSKGWELTSYVTSHSISNITFIFFHVFQYFTSSTLILYCFGANNLLMLWKPSTLCILKIVQKNNLRLGGVSSAAVCSGYTLISSKKKRDWPSPCVFISAGTEILDRKSVQQERVCSYHSKRQRPP